MRFAAGDVERKVKEYNRRSDWLWTEIEITLREDVVGNKTRLWNLQLSAILRHLVTLLKINVLLLRL